MLNQKKNILSSLRCRIFVVSAFQHSEVAPLMKEFRCFSSNATHDARCTMNNFSCWGLEVKNNRAGKKFLVPLVAEGVPVQDTQTSRKWGQRHEMLPSAATAQRAHCAYWLCVARKAHPCPLSFVGWTAPHCNFSSVDLYKWIYWYQNKVPPKAK